MENLRCAAQPELPPALQLRFQARAIAFSKLMDATLSKLPDRQTATAQQPAALPASLPASRARPAPEAAGMSTPPQPQQAESRHERRRRERAERHLAAAAARAPARQPATAPAQPAGVAQCVPDQASHQLLLAEVAARAGSTTALAA